MLSRQRIDYAREWGADRAERAQRILLEGYVFLVRETRGKDYFEVQSQRDSSRYYRVILQQGVGVCECPDHLHRVPECKHIRACRMYKLSL